MGSDYGLSAIVLAGGQSSRMGRDKALIPVKGVALLRRVCQVALDCTPLVYVVTSRVEEYAGVVPAGCRFVRELVNQTQPSPPGGPLLGFARGLAQVETEWVLLLACDLPLLEAAALQQNMASLGQVGDSLALLPKTAKGWEPLCGFYRASCLPGLQAAIGAGERSFQGWLAGQSVRELALENPAMVFNCNTPTDLALLNSQPPENP